MILASGTGDGKLTGLEMVDNDDDDDDGDDGVSVVVEGDAGDGVFVGTLKGAENVCGEAERELKDGEEEIKAFAERGL